MQLEEKIARPPRIFLPEDFKVTTWESIRPYYETLLNRELHSANDLRNWFRHRSELESVVAEDFAWRYINMTRFTDNPDFNQSYTFFVKLIQPEIAPLTDQLNRKSIECPWLTELEQLPGYDILIRNLRKDIEIYRKENVPLFTEISLLQQKYNQIVGSMTIHYNGQELTLQQASVLLQEPDRHVRETVYRLIAERRLQESDDLDDIFSRLIHLRHRIAQNAGFSNFRDYMFKALGRFDYTPADCFAFHDSVKKCVVPLLNERMRRRLQLMKLPTLRPWDKVVDPLGRPPLKAFQGGADLIDRSIRCLTRIHPYLGQCLRTMHHMQHLDVESRKGKAPGGYNYPLAELGVPFIFMNATSTLRDMVTFMHEGGHAVHNFLTRNLELHDFKSPPSEVAELASMSMELISMEAWDEFFPRTQDLNRAISEQLEDILETLPWVATIDKFQHRLYEQPDHTAAERRKIWTEVLMEFSDALTDWSGLEKEREYLWQKQLHLYEVPFYYIEYGIAQLGALALWRNYRLHPSAAMEEYFKALQLGYTRTIPEIYQAAGICFDFSEAYIATLMTFVWEELKRVS